MSASPAADACSIFTSWLFLVVSVSCPSVSLFSSLRFHEGSVDFLLASELASRGLDVNDVAAVINFAPPKDVDR